MSEKKNQPGGISDIPEYRLVRIQEDSGSSPHEPVDLRELAGEVRSRSKIVWRSLAVCIVLGLFIALGSESSYESRVKLMPEAHQPSGLGAIGGIARQFGISALPDGTIGDGIPADLYPDITRSIIIMNQMMEHEVELPERYRNGPDDNPAVTLHEYFSEYKRAAPVEWVSRYTIGLPFTILGGIRDMMREEEETVRVSVEGTHFDQRRERIVRMTWSEWEMFEELQQRISVEMDIETGVLNVAVSMPDAEMAADVADHLVQLLTEYITDYRTEKARRDVEFVQERFEEKLARFENVQEALARFRDENRGQLSQLARTREQRLQSEYDLAFNLYQAMAERLEDARIKLQEDTPALTVLDPAVVPNERSWPKRSLIMIFSAFFGVLIGVVWVLSARALRNQDRVRL